MPIINSDFTVPCVRCGFEYSAHRDLDLRCPEVVGSSAFSHNSGQYFVPTERPLSPLHQAAPDLLAAIKGVAAIAARHIAQGHETGMDAEFLRRAEAAIARAEGR